MSVKAFIIVLLSLLLLSETKLGAQETEVLTAPAIIDFNVEKGQVVEDSLVQITITAVNASGKPDVTIEGGYLFLVGDTVLLQFTGGRATYQFSKKNTGLVFFEQTSISRLYHISVDQQEVSICYIPLWLSILPPLIAIICALVFKEVILSLFAGVWVGAFITSGMSLRNLLTSFLHVIDDYAVRAMFATDHISIIIFSLMIGGMVAIISRNGGMQGIVNILSRYARTARSAQLVTWLMGILIFFDDYANTLIVGNTMRPVTDRFKVSREKLSYIVDSTAAPVASIAFITTWIGAEIGYIKDSLAHLGIESSAYSIFFQSLKYAYYPVFTVGFMFLLIYLRKDYGTMYQAESQARAGKITDIHEKANTSDLEVKEGVEPKWYNAFFPVLAVIVATMAGLLVTGYRYSDPSDLTLGVFGNLSVIIGNADSYVALLWASLSGVVVALLFSWTGRLLSPKESMESLLEGFKALLPAMVILVAAWSLAILTKELHTATFITSSLMGKMDPKLMPLLTFILAGTISFSTGSSWSTMAILYPILIPTTWLLSTSASLESHESMMILTNVVAVVLAGSVFGDHCSPISDTTILSSLASNCDHIEHVRTQLPYAITVGLVSMLTGGLLFYLGIPWWINFIVGLGLLLAIINTFGKIVPE